MTTQRSMSGHNPKSTLSPVQTINFSSWSGFHVASSQDISLPDFWMEHHAGTFMHHEISTWPYPTYIQVFCAWQIKIKLKLLKLLLKSTLFMYERRSQLQSFKLTKSRACPHSLFSTHLAFKPTHVQQHSLLIIFLSLLESKRCNSDTSINKSAVALFRYNC